MATIHSRCPKCGNATPLIWRIWRGVKHRMCAGCWAAKERADDKLRGEVRK